MRYANSCNVLRISSDTADNSERTPIHQHSIPDVPTSSRHLVSDFHEHNGGWAMGEYPSASTTTRSMLIRGLCEIVECSVRSDFVGWS